MGLGKGDADHAMRRVASAWALPLGIAVTAVLLGLAADVGREWFRFDRTGIAAGEAWRLVSGHLVHLGWSHLALNLAGLLLVWYLVGDSLTPRRWAIVALVTVIGIDLGLWTLQPRLDWYVGLSGVLHGLLAAGIVAGRQTYGSWALGGALLVKLAYEQFAGPLPGSEASTGGAVITVAHLYGAVSGALVGAVYAVRRRSARL